MASEPNPESRKIHDFLITTVAGLEEIVLDQLRSGLAGASGFQSESDRRHGRVFFRYTRSPRALLDLKAAVTTFGLLARIHRVTVGGPGAERICRRISLLDFSGARSLARACDREVDTDKFELSCTVSGSHRFTRSELSQRVRELLASEHGLLPARAGNGLRLRLQVTGSRALLAVQLGSRRSIGGPQAGASGAMTHTLARILDLGSEDRIVCVNVDTEGLAELADTNPRGLMACCPQPTATKSPETPPVRVGTVFAGIHALPVSTESVSCIMDGAACRAAGYAPRLAEFARVLAPGGVAVTIFSKAEAVAGAVRSGDLPFEILAAMPIYVRGRKYSCCLLERLAR